jgi:hypothetical protein
MIVIERIVSGSASSCFRRRGSGCDAQFACRRARVLPRRDVSARIISSKGFAVPVNTNAPATPRIRRSRLGIYPRYKVQQGLGHGKLSVGEVPANGRWELGVARQGLAGRFACDWAAGMGWVCNASTKDGAERHERSLSSLTPAAVPVAQNIQAIHVKAQGKAPKRVPSGSVRALFKPFLHGVGGRELHELGHAGLRVGAPTRGLVFGLFLAYDLAAVVRA